MVRTIANSFTMIQALQKPDHLKTSLKSVLFLKVSNIQMSGFRIPTVLKKSGIQMPFEYWTGIQLSGSAFSFLVKSCVGGTALSKTELEPVLNRPCFLGHGSDERTADNWSEKHS